MHLYAGENRALRIALVISIALHALLLFALPGLSESQRRSVARVPLVARILQPRVEPVAAPAPAAPETRKAIFTPAAKPAASARTAPERVPTPPVAQVASAAPSTHAETVAAADPAAPIQVARVAQQPVPAAEQALDAGTLAQYRLAIISAARRFKRYPRAALDNTWQGRVEIHMAIGANGAIAALSVRSSTGHPVLDQQALEMIERAKATAPIPASLRGREFVVDIPVIFSLREPGA